MTAPVLWLTGLPSSGKTTIAQLAAERLRGEGYRVEVLDGDELRGSISAGLGFSREDRNVHARRAAFVAGLLARHGIVVIAALVSPYRESRERIREELEHFIEVYVRCPVEVCRSRDPKGLYRRHGAGELRGLTGVDDPYEEPMSPELVLDTDRTSVTQCALAVVRKVREWNPRAARFKRNLNEVRIFAMRRSGHHGVIAWIAGHFQGEVYRYNDVASHRAFGAHDEEYVNASPSDRRDCYLLNVEDADLPSCMSRIASGEWETDCGPSDRVHHVLVLRDPYNMMASRVAMFGRDPDGGRASIDLWKQHAREFTGRTSHLPPGTVRVSYNDWHSSRAYRRSVSDKLGLAFTDKGLGRMIVASSFNRDAKDATTIDTSERWRSLDPELKSLLLDDAKVTALVLDVWGPDLRRLVSL